MVKKRELTNQKGRIKSGQGFRLFLVFGFRNPWQGFTRKLLFLWRDAPSAGGWGDGAFKMLYSWWGSVKLFKDSYDGGISWEGFSLNQFFFSFTFCLLTVLQDLVIFGFFSFSLHTSLFSIFPYFFLLSYWFCKYCDIYLSVFPSLFLCLSLSVTFFSTSPLYLHDSVGISTCLPHSSLPPYIQFIPSSLSRCLSPFL